MEQLEAGRTYTATLYADGEGPRDVRKSQQTVRRGDVLELRLPARGGTAVVFHENKP